MTIFHPWWWFDCGNHPSHPYVALSPTLYPLSSHPALPAGECPLQRCCCQHPATRITLIRPTSSPAHTLTCLLGPAKEGMCKSPIALLDDDDKLPLPKHRLSPGHGMPDNNKPKKWHRVMQLQPFHTLVVFQPPEPHGECKVHNSIAVYAAMVSLLYSL